MLVEKELSHREVEYKQRILFDIHRDLGTELWIIKRLEAVEAELKITYVKD